MSNEEKRLAEIGRLCAGTGHNIMTPLSLIMMHSDMLALKLKGQDTLLKHLEEIGDQVTRLTRIAELMMWKTQVAQKKTPTIIQVGTLVQDNLDFWLGDMFFKHNLEKTFKINIQTPPVNGVPFYYTSFMDEWIICLTKRAKGLNGTKFSVHVDIMNEKEFSLSFSDTAPPLSEKQITALESSASDDGRLRAKIFPALHQFLMNSPTDVTLIRGDEGQTTLKVTWNL